jgi:hypothetical protein
MIPMSPEDEAIVAEWCAVVRSASRRSDIEVAAPFQRHYLKLGTGLPPNFCLALTAQKALFFKFDPRHAAHPRMVTPDQIKKLVSARPRATVRVATLEQGRLAIGVHFEIADRDRTWTLPCRTPELATNPAAAAMIVALGGTLPDA